MSFKVAIDAIGSYYMKNSFNFEMVYNYVYGPDAIKLTVYGYNTKNYY